MKLWLLESRDDLTMANDPWWRKYDCFIGFVVRSESAENARKLANELAKNDPIDRPVWLDDRYSTCTEVTQNGDEDLILASYKNG